MKSVSPGKIAIAALVIIFIVWSAKKKKQSLISTQSQITQTSNPPPERPVALDSQKGNNSPATATTSGGVAKASRLDLCQNFKSNQFLVPKHLLWVLVSGKATAMIFPDDTENCLTSDGGNIYLSFAGFSNQEPQPYFYFHQATGSIKLRKKSLVLDDILSDADKMNKLGFKKETLQKFLHSIYGTEEDAKTWTYVELDIINKNLDAKTYFTPKTHPFAKNLGKEELTAMLGQGALLVDVRPEKSFNQDHISGAVNIPTEIPDVANGILSVAEMGSAGYTIFPTLLPKDPNTPIIVINRNPVLFSAYNTITLLHSMGFTKLYVYWGGFDEWTGHSIVASDTIPGIKFISFDDLKTSLKNQSAVLIDVRSPKEFEKDHISEAMNASFNQLLDDGKFPVYRADGLTKSALNEHGESFAGSNPVITKAKVILIGAHVYDWRPLKAAIMLQNPGTEVTVYREGMRDWQFRKSLEPELTTIDVRNKSLPAKPQLSKIEKAIKGANIVYDPKTNAKILVKQISRPEGKKLTPEELAALGPNVRVMKRNPKAHEAGSSPSEVIKGTLNQNTLPTATPTPTH